MKNCLNCGASNNIDAKFCLHCGNSFNTINNNIEMTNSIENNSQPISNVSVNNSIENKKDRPKSNKSQKKLIIVCIIIGILLLGTILYLLLSPANKQSEKNNNGSNSKTQNRNEKENPASFFVINQDYQYAMFDENGKKLTDFVITSTSLDAPTDKIASNILVQENSGAYKILNANGEIIHSFEQNYYIKQYEYLIFNAEFEGSKGNLYNFNGEIVLKDVDEPYYYSKYPLMKDDNTYNLLNENGKEIYSVTVPENKDIETEYQKDIIIIYYGSFGTDYNYFFYDVANNKAIYENLIVPSGYKFEEANKDYSKMIFKKLDKYIYYENGIKVKEGETSNCYPKLENEKLICYSLSTNYFFDEYGNVDTTMPFEFYEVLDENHYAVLNNNQVYIYENDTLVNTIEAPELDSDNKAFYILGHITNGGRYYYIVDKSGNILNNYNETIAWEKISNDMIFTSNKPINSSATDTNYYTVLYKENGEKIELDKTLGSFHDISYYSDNLIVGTRVFDAFTYTGVIMDGKGNVIFEGKKLNYYENSGNSLVSIYDESKEKYIIYYLNDKSVLAMSSDEPEFNKYYLKIFNNNKTEYYSYTTGKKFYSE